MSRAEEIKKLTDELGKSYLTREGIEDQITALRAKIRDLEEEKKMADEGILLYQDEECQPGAEYFFKPAEED